MNYIKCADRPIVFDELSKDCKRERWMLRYGGGDLWFPFQPAELRISASTGRLYHQFSSKHFLKGREPNFGLIRSQLAVELSRSITFESQVDAIVATIQWEDHEAVIPYTN